MGPRGLMGMFQNSPPQAAALLRPQVLSGGTDEVSKCPRARGPPGEGALLEHKSHLPEG